MFFATRAIIMWSIGYKYSLYVQLKGDFKQRKKVHIASPLLITMQKELLNKFDAAERLTQLSILPVSNSSIIIQYLYVEYKLHKQQWVGLS